MSKQTQNRAKQIVIAESLRALTPRSFSFVLARATNPNKAGEKKTMKSNISFIPSPCAFLLALTLFPDPALSQSNFFNERLRVLERNFCRTTGFCPTQGVEHLKIEDVKIKASTSQSIATLSSRVTLRPESSDELSPLDAHLECSNGQLRRLSKSQLSKHEGTTTTVVTSVQHSVLSEKMNHFTVEYELEEFGAIAAGSECELDLVFNLASLDKNIVSGVAFNIADCREMHGNAGVRVCVHKPNESGFWFRAYSAWLGIGTTWDERPGIASEVNSECLGKSECRPLIPAEHGASVLKLDGVCVRGRQLFFSEVDFLLDRPQATVISIECDDARDR